jgi:mono/diheme cytochrome c family protein
MKHDSCEPIPLGAMLALILGSLASAVLTAGTMAFFLMALMLSAGETMAAQPGDGAGRAKENAPAQTKAADPPQLALSRKTTAPQPDRALVARGRYLVQTAGCNDCHTPGYAEAAGKVPEQAWLTGDRLGWRGPWGTSYATNLRLRLAGMSRDEWLHFARAMEPRPPMPWFNVRAMDDRDLTAIWAYVQALGPAGEPAPDWVPPGQAPVGPVVRFPQ